MSQDISPSITRREALARGVGLLAAGVFFPHGVFGPRVLSASGGPGIVGPEILTRAIPSSGERIPALGMGTWQTFDVGEDTSAREPLREVLRIFVEMGGSAVDASPMYGTSEEVLGDLAAELGIQDDLWWATKVWTEGAPEGVAQMEESMGLLRRPRIELMQVHNLVDTETHLATLEAWKEEGRIDYIGITRSQSRAFPEVERWMDDERLDFIQINYSMAEREAEDRILPKAAERGLAVMLNRPLGGGALFGAVEGRELPDWAAEFDCHSWSQFFLKYVLGHPAVTCAIPATSNPVHMRDNMAAGYGRLPEDPAIRRRMVEYLEG
ncbi:MAG: aldo/keto reductase [Gemmatimonadales bacterium]|nr:MAG: aldo/keto reductase [Gemmatimonadales bacterium]